MILSHKLERYKTLLIKKKKYKIINIIYALPDFLQVAKNISLFENCIVLCKNNKMNIFYFHFDEEQKHIKFEKSFNIIKTYIKI